MRGSCHVAISWIRCANGETYEFWLTIGGVRVSKSTWMNVPNGTSVETVAALAYIRLLGIREPYAEGITSAHAPTCGRRDEHRAPEQCAVD